MNSQNQHIQLEKIFLAPKRKPISFSDHPPSPAVPPPPNFLGSRQPWIYFHIDLPILDWSCIWSHGGLLWLAFFFLASLMFSRVFHVEHASILQSFLELNNVSFYGRLSTHQLVDLLVVSTLWLLWIMLPWTQLYKFLHTHRFSLLWGIYIPRSGIAGPHRTRCLTFWENSQTVFQSSCTVSRSHQQRTRAPVSPHRHQCLLITCLLDESILVHVKWCLLVALICISLMASGAEPLFMCLLAICKSSLVSI